MTTRGKIAFLFDVDNTLLHSDRVLKDLRDHLEREFGAVSRVRYWGNPARPVR